MVTWHKEGEELAHATREKGDISHYTGRSRNGGAGGGQQQQQHAQQLFIVELLIVY